MPMAIYSGLTVQQKQMRKLAGQAGLFPRAAAARAVLWLFLRGAEPDQFGSADMLCTVGNLGVSILPAQDMAQKTHETLQRISSSTAELISSGRLLPNLGWLMWSWGDRALLNPSWPYTKLWAASTLIPSAYTVLSLSSRFFQQSSITSLRMHSLVYCKLFY